MVFVENEEEMWWIVVGVPRADASYGFHNSCDLRSFQFANNKPLDEGLAEGFLVAPL